MAEQPNQQSEENKAASSSNKVQIPSEETKKATLPVKPSNAAAASLDEENKDIGDEQEDDQYDEDGQEETKGQPIRQKIFNQAQSNIPIATPEIEEYKELLDQNAAYLQLKPAEKLLLTKAIEKGTFSKTA